MANLRLCTIGKKTVDGHTYTGQIDLIKLEDCGPVRIESDNTVTIVLNRTACKKLIEHFTSYEAGN